MDQMIGELKNTLDKRGKDYVLVLYGDHIPSLTFEDGQFNTGKENQTEYVIISNFDTGLEDKDIYSYELSDYLLRALGFKPGIIQDIHKAYFDEDLINSQINETSSDETADSTDEAATSEENESEEKTPFDKNVHEIQYDMLYGGKYIYNSIEPYGRVDMRLGLYDTAISAINYNSSTGSIVVRGENFTTFSKILINEERMPTTYIDENTIMIIPEEVSAPPEIGDTFVVAQIDKDKHELSRSASMNYSGE